MNKLQLYIAKSLRGYKGLVSFNATDEVQRHVHDLRKALGNINYDPLEKNIFYMVRYIAGGTLLSILRTIPTEPLDHLEATVFVPAASLVSAEELDEVVREITRKMSAPGMSGDDVAELRRLFDRDYPDRASEMVLEPSSRDGGYARCCYGGMSGRRLADYFGPHLYQPEWTPFAGVLLLDADLGIDGPAVDLSGEPLATSTSQLPPAPARETPPPHTRPEPAGRVYRFQMPVRSTGYGAPVSFEIVTDATITDSPIEGYEALDTIRDGVARVNMLAYSGAGRAATRRCIIVGALCLLAGLVLGFCLFAGGKDEAIGRNKLAAVEAPQPAAADSAVAAEPAPSAAPAEPAKAEAAAPAAPTEQSLEAAIKYLDENRIWNRTRMEDFEALAGLFDDMNAMNLDRLRGPWAEKLKASKNFGAVVRAAEGSQRKKVNLHRDNRTTYNKPGDLAIGYVGYTYWIDP